MRFSRTLGMAAGLIVLATPFMTLADSVSTHNLQMVQQKYPNTGNNPAQGRFYDEYDQWLDPQTGMPIPGAPSMKEGASGGGGGGGGGGGD